MVVNKHCSTCEFWLGVRNATSDGRSVEIANNARGKCHLNKMDRPYNASYCQKYKKWGLLK